MVPERLQGHQDRIFKNITGFSQKTLFQARQCHRKNRFQTVCPHALTNIPSRSRLILNSTPLNSARQPVTSAESAPFPDPGALYK